MNVLLLDPADFVGGAELFTLDLLPALSRTNTITLVTSGRSAQYLKRIPSEVRVIKYGLPRLRPFRPCAYLKAVFHIRRLCKQKRIELVHSNSVRAGLVAAACGKPWVHVAHDFTLPKIFAGVFRRAKVICTCSEAVKQDLIDKGITAENIRVVHNGIDLKHSQSLIPHRLKADSPIIAIVGRLDPWKGQDIFLAAAQRIRTKIPAARFVIYGEASAHDPATEAYEKLLKASAPDFVEFVPFRPMDEILQTIDLLVHASTQPEPFGRVVLEAMAANVPVVAAWSGGVPEILGADMREFGHEPGNVEELAEKVIRIAGDPALRNTFTAKAKARVERFAIEDVAAKVIKCWENAHHPVSH